MRLYKTQQGNVSGLEIDGAACRSTRLQSMNTSSDPFEFP